jgi:hypothetical protein
MAGYDGSEGDGEGREEREREREREKVCYYLKDNIYLKVKIS